MVGGCESDAWGGNMQQETCLLIDKNVSEKKTFWTTEVFEKIFFLFSFLFWPINKQIADAQKNV